MQKKAILSEAIIEVNEVGSENTAPIRFKFTGKKAVSTILKAFLTEFPVYEGWEMNVTSVTYGKEQTYYMPDSEFFDKATII